MRGKGVTIGGEGVMTDVGVTIGEGVTISLLCEGVTTGVWLTIGEVVMTGVGVTICEGVTTGVGVRA